MENKYRLTYPQKNIWLVDMFNKNTNINVISGIFKVTETDFNEKIHIKVLNELVKRNDGLRLRIMLDGENPVQYVEKYIKFDVETVDMTGKTKSEIDRYIEKEASKPIDILNSKLYQFKIIKYSDKKSGTLCRFHHVIGDAWSFVQFATQYSKYYDMVSKGEQITDELNPSYLEYINSEDEYSKSEKYGKDEEFWREYLKDINNPISLKNSSQKITNKAKRYAIKLDQNINDEITKFCKENRISPYVLFLTAVATYIYRVMDQNDFIIGTPVLNRSNFKEKQMLGMCVSTIPMRFKFEEGLKFTDFARKISSDTMSIFRHQKYPYSKMLEYVHNNSDIKTNLYNIVLSYQNARADYIDKEKYNSKWIVSNYIQDEVAMHIVDINNDGKLEIYYDYLVDLLGEVEIKYLHSRLMAIIKDVLENNDKTVDDVCIMSQEEENKILFEYNDTYKNYDLSKTIIDFFEEQVKKTPDSVALVYEDQVMTYKELNEKINNFALKIKDIKNENIVICMENSFELIIAIYGVLKSGNNYVPLNIDTPRDRIENIIKDCGCKYVIADRVIENVNMLYILYDENLGTKYDNQSKSHELAYIIYTSGSTGLPKGVRIQNSSLTNYILWARDSYASEVTPIMPLYSSIGFDLTVTTLFMPLICGGQIVIYDNSGEEIINIFKEDKVNVVKLTPAHLSLVNEADIKVKNIKVLIVGGEALKTSDAKKITNNSNGICIYNEYGPTEATVGCMIYKYNIKDKSSTVSIGKPAANTQIYILNSKGKVCPLGTVGELCISGEGLSQGYNNIKDKTEKVFVMNKELNKKMYKTGDVAKLNFDLTCQYFGRNDNQIKINGNRIELEEIEHIVKDNVDVKNAVVDVKVIANTPNICLYYIADKEYEYSYINNVLKNILPQYMIPSKIMKIKKIPLNNNGKVNRKELPIPDVKAKVRLSKVTYETELEKQLCELWGQILEIDNIYPEDNIFDYGVDSLNIIRCQVKLSNYMDIIDVQKFYEYPVIRDFCKNANINKINNHIKKGRLEEFRDLNFEKTFTSKETKNVILTGATGYLGINMLKELILNSQIEKIYCIVRGKDSSKRLKNRFNFFFDEKYDDVYNKKVHVLNGEITKERFGLEKTEFEKIISEASSIINAAAIVKHNGSYKEFETVNVDTVKNIIKLCIKYKLVLEHISTMSVAGHSGIGCFDESKFYIDQDFQINPYILSKFEAELLIYESIQKYGLKANVYRVGNLTWRYDNGKYQYTITDNGFFMRIKNMFNLGVYPASFRNIKIEMTPVDYAADFIVSLILNKEKEVNKVYHIYNDKTIPFSKIVACLKKSNKNITEMEDDVFMRKLKMYDSSENILLNDIMSSINTLNVLTNNKKTNELLQKSNKSWPNIDEKYAMNLLEYLNNVDGDEVDEKVL